MHIISMADEDCGSIAPAARQFEIFLDYLVAKSIACTSFFMDERYLGMLQPEHAAETAETRLLHALRTFVEQVPFICVCVSVCMYTYTHIRTHTHTYTHTYVCARAHAAETAETHLFYAYAQVHIRTYVRTYIHTYKHTYIHTKMHASMHACMHAYIHPHKHT